jgi:AcrR family transcriptional regulator
MSLEAIARTGIEIADDDGLVAVSMREVADRLGFTTMSLYRYVPGKAELIDVMLDTALGWPPPLDEARATWRTALERWARAYLRVLFEHPWVLELIPRRPPGPNQVAWLDAAVHTLRGTGLSVQENLATVLLVSSYVGSAAQLIFTLSGQGRGDVGARPMGSGWASAMERVVADQRFPALSSIVASRSFAEDGSQIDPFEFGLQRVLDGIETHVRRQTSRHSGRARTRTRAVAKTEARRRSDR